MPGPSCIITVLIPRPLQPLQVITALASVPPTPLHFPHILCLSTVTLISLPVYKSSRVTSRPAPVGLTFFFWGGPPPPLPPMPKRSKISPIPEGPPPPPLSPSSPYLSYIFLFSGSLSTS